MCPFCTNGCGRPCTTYHPEQYPDFAPGTQATVLHALALVCVARGLEPAACRACKRLGLTHLVAVSRSIVAECRSAGSDDSGDQLTVALQCADLFFDLFRRARDLVGKVGDSDSPGDVLWTLERVRYLAKALANLAALAGGALFKVADAKRALTDLADLVTDVCEAQIAVTGEGQPEWHSAGPAYRADRLAVFLYDAAEQLDMASRGRSRASG